MPLLIAAYLTANAFVSKQQICTEYLISQILKSGLCYGYGMSAHVNEIYTVTFANETDRIKAFEYLLDTNASFKGIGTNTLVIQKKDYDALKRLGIQF